MNRTTILATCAFIVSCRDIAGVGPITYTGDDSGPSCRGQLLFSSSDLGDIRVGGGFVFAEVTSSGIESCSINGCSAPTDFFTASLNDTYVGFTASSSLLYYMQDATADAGGKSGNIHSISFDGTNDVQLAGSLGYPDTLAASGSRVFWVDDPNQSGTGPASVNCIGCTGPASAPWITALNATYAFTASANNVYVVADFDGTGATYTLYACSVQNPCLATPKTILSNVDVSVTNLYLAADDTYVYLIRNDHADIVRLDMTGALTQIVKGTNAYAITLDTTGNLYYTDDSGTIFGIKSDGSGTPQTIACATTTSLALALATDDTSLYYIFSDPQTSVYKVPKLP